MSAFARQKACIPCADSKRRCDKTLPECQRCLDRDTDCAYPQPKRRRKERTWRQSETIQAPALPDFSNVNTPAEANLNIADWSAIEADDLDWFLSLPDDSSLSVPRFAPIDLHHLQEGSVMAISKPDLWFLQPESWDLRLCTEPTDCITSSALDCFIDRIRGMLQDLVQKGYNGFIHRRLYEKGMPTCLQDAFTTLATYVAQTEAVREIILQIVDDRASELALQSPIVAGTMHGIMTQLAHVQSLFIYVFIQFFDGSIRARASAEKLVPTLRHWVKSMWETVKACQEDDLLPSDHHEALLSTSEFNRQYHSTSDMWRLWILIESLRRSQVIVSAVIKVYQTVTKGLAECRGDVMITARNGLWEADSALKWLDLSSARSPLLVSALQPGPVIAQNTPEAIDAFAIMYWRFVAGEDKIRYWIDKSAASGTGQDISVG